MAGKLKLSDQLFDAVLTGNQQAQDKIRAEIAALSQTRSHNYDSQGFSPDYAAILDRPDAAPMAIAKWMAATYGPEWNTWENETIRAKLFHDFGVAMSQTTSDRVFAIKAAMNSTQPLEDWYAFNQVAMALCGSGADFLVLAAPTPAMAIFAFEFCKTYHPDFEPEDEVLKYIACIMYINGIFTPPPSLYDDVNIIMKWMTTKETQALWHEIYLKYNDVASSPEADHGEDVVSIQAQRIHDAELAALKYAGV